MSSWTVPALFQWYARRANSDLTCLIPLTQPYFFGPLHDVGQIEVWGFVERMGRYKNTWHTLDVSVTIIINMHRSPRKMSP